MKIEIDKSQVEQDVPFNKEVTVYVVEYRPGVIPESSTHIFTDDELDIDIIGNYLGDKNVGAITITYKPEPAETLNGVDIFYSPEIDWEGQLEFRIYTTDKTLLESVNLGYLDNLALVQVLTTLDGAVSIEVE